MIEDLFQHPKPIIAVVHVGALPGTPAAMLTIDELTDFKEGGLWSNTVEPARVRKLVEAVRRLRTGKRPEVR